LEHIVDKQPDQIAATQLAIDDEVEKREALGLDDPVARESGSPRFPSASAGLLAE